MYQQCCHPGVCGHRRYGVTGCRAAETGDTACQSWAGVEFTLKTDAGMYPNAIPVDETGVLKLEIGGSKSYVLSCLQSSIDIPVPDNNTPATLMTLTRDKQNAAAAEEKDAKQSETIPVTQIVFLAVGIVLAISTLVAIHITSKRHSSDDDDEDDDE